jgi:hypothetical protein
LDFKLPTKLDNNLLLLIGGGVAGLMAVNFLMKKSNYARANQATAQAYYSVADHSPYVHAILNTIPTQINLPPVPYDYNRIHTLAGIGVDRTVDDWFNPPLNP